MHIESQRDQWPDRVAQYRRAVADDDDWPVPKGHRVKPDGTLSRNYDADAEFHSFSPTDINPPSSTSARPEVNWEHDPEAHPSLDLGLPGSIDFKNSEGGPTTYSLPLDRKPQKLYRGISMGLYDPEISRALFGDMYDLSNFESKDPMFDWMPRSRDAASATHEWGQPNPELANKILDRLIYDKYNNVNLGRHWTTSHDEAQRWANENYNDFDRFHPLTIEADWYGEGEDPYRTDTEGDHPDEKEMTLLPGTPLQVRNLHIQHPKSGDWHPMFPDPHSQHRTAADWSQPTHMNTPLHDNGSRPEFYHPDEYTDRRHFSPTDFNPPANSPSRPTVRWKATKPEQPTLPMDTPKYFSPGVRSDVADALGNLGQENGWGSQVYPVDRQPQKLYRGVRLPMDHPALAQFTRSLYGPEYSTKSHGDGLFPQPEHTADPRGWNNTDLGQHVLDYLNGGHRQGEQGVGRHWSTNHGTAKEFAGQADSKELSAIISADWMGRGEDPYRTDTYGDYNSEDELTMMGGAPLDIRDIRLQHPETKQWHSIYDPSKPQQVTASFYSGDSGLYGDPAADDEYDDEYEDENEDGFYDGQEWDAQPQFGYTSTPMFPDERPAFEHPDKGYFVPHYSPREINPPSNAPARPDVTWERGNKPQDPTLPMNYYDYSRNRMNLPIDRNPVKLYRGINLNLNDPDLQHLRRFLHGDALEDDDPFMNDWTVAPHSGGYYRNEKADRDYLPLELDEPGLPPPSNKALSRKKGWQPGEDTGDMHQQILDFMERGGRGMGTHWSTDKDQAMQFARSNGWGGKANLPVVITHDWYGSGEDPYRTGTEGEWSEEKEITKLPGSTVNVSGVEMYHNPGVNNSGVPGWHHLYRGKPIPRLAVKTSKLKP